jgi:hypothetical protein
MEHIPKTGVYFILNSDDVISEYGYMRIGKLNHNYIVEDQYTTSIYKCFSMALIHFYDNIRIDKMIEAEVA